LKGTVPFSPDENRDSPHDENRDSPREQFDEATLREIDQAVEWGRRYGVHVCINFHRAPGYTVADPPERTNLWTDPQPQRACAAHWAMFARRYRGIPNERLSFNLVNEPGHVEPKVYAAVVARLAAAIRAEDPRRLIIADGLEWGRLPVPELAPLRVAQAGRGYTPMELSHYQASWVHGERFPRPQWPRPVPPNGTPFGLPVEDRAWLWKTCIEPWQAVESRGVGVMVGEWGVFNRTPHDVVLRWAEDSLRNWQQAGWGWAMWNFRGSMGIIDSGRDDVQYEDLAGHKLDRQLLDLLQRY
jgi:endoglucanase